MNSTPLHEKKGSGFSPEPFLQPLQKNERLRSNAKGTDVVRLPPSRTPVPPWVPGANTVERNETVDPAVPDCAGAFRLRPIVSANVREESSRVAATTNRANSESVRTVFFIMVDFP